MRKAQGALEYLIIIAAVLAIAAIVVLFLTNALVSVRGDISNCKLAASRCQQGVETGLYVLDATSGLYEGCSTSCDTACTDPAGDDVLTGGVQDCTDSDTGCYQCKAANPDGVVKTA